MFIKRIFIYYLLWTSYTWCTKTKN